MSRVTSAPACPNGLRGGTGPILVDVVTIRVEVDDDVATRLAERARQSGVSAEELARRAVAEFVRERPRVGDLSFFGVGASDELQAEHTDELLAEGFGA